MFRILNVQARKANKVEGLKERWFQNHLPCPFFMKREERKTGILQEIKMPANAMFTGICGGDGGIRTHVSVAR